MFVVVEDNFIIIILLCIFFQSTSAYDGVKQIAAPLSKKLNAEYWAVSSKTGLNINNFFHRVAFLAFDSTISREINNQEINQTISK